MNERTPRPRDIASGALLLGGIFVFLFPQHSLSVFQVMIVTVAAATGVHALLVTAPTVWWTSPFERRRDGAVTPPGSEQLSSIRSMLSGRRQILEGGVALPPQTIRLLKPLIEGALEREGVDLYDDKDRSRAKGSLAPATWAVLMGEPLMWPRWYQTNRPNERAVSRVVDAVLDDIEQMAIGSRSPQIGQDT